jgi:hypothetical protein
MLPNAYLALSREERAFIVASIEIKIEVEKRLEKEAKRK